MPYDLTNPLESVELFLYFSIMRTSLDCGRNLDECGFQQRDLILLLMIDSGICQLDSSSKVTVAAPKLSGRADGVRFEEMYGH